MTHTINVPLARKVLDQIEAAPQRWTQDIWLERPYELDEQSAEDTVENCETSGCFAGWTVVLSGHRTAAPYHVGPRVRDVSPQTRARIRTLYGWMLMGDDDSASVDELINVRAVAAAELGLDVDQASTLFEASNTLSDLYTYLEAWTDGEITPPAPEDRPEWWYFDTEQMAEYFGRWNDADDAFGGEG